MQRPLCCAQAPDIFVFATLACFAAIAGDIDAVASAAAIAILPIRFIKALPDLLTGKLSGVAPGGQARGMVVA
jgi:hypothetical protein